MLIITSSAGFQITATNGITFNTIRVDKGEPYGPSETLIWDKNEPLIEFYDTRFPFTRHGQFISRYYLSSLVDNHDPKKGLNLYGGVDDWKIDAASLQKVLEHWTHAR